MKNTTKIRIALAGFVFLLLLSGITAFPIRSEIAFLSRHLNAFPVFMREWITELADVIESTPDIFLYGTDWLAFAHIIIALFFIPVFFNPVKHRANILTGIAACFLVVPLAFICGPVRGIPFFHQLIDCGFGVGGMLFLIPVNKWIKEMEIVREFRNLKSKK